ncbi:MAG TPA: membrane protein insertase YidC [Prolixibacteraceae bacterium]|nr:membrane protein insertase YidC [Prolixibacteraceae bacterium]HPR60804.1 membrane protein insertase YidC [Prolixibacteraceae bacterium]
MDRNTTIGLVLIFAVLMVFSYINKPSKEKIDEARRKQDSIELVQQQLAIEANELKNEQEQVVEASLPQQTDVVDVENDQLKNLYGDFSVSAVGEEEFYIIENNLLKVVVSSVGGKIHSVELKNYKRHDSTALLLIEPEKSTHNLSFFAQNRNIKTDELFFKPVNGTKHVEVSGPDVPKGREGRIKFNNENPGESSELVLRLDAGNGRYIDYVYSITHNSYVVGYDIRMNGMDELINTNTGYLSFNFNVEVPRQERPSKFGEDRYTSIYYQFFEADIDNLNLNKSDKETLNTPIKWIGYKQLFFSTVLMAETSFSNAIVESEKYDDKNHFVAGFKSDIGLAFDSRGNNNYDMSFYFGPNHYQTLREHGNDLEKLINLGFPVVREVNRYLIIPVFNFLRRHIDNFGIIILILTVMIRLIVFPFTYKSYVSQAKMRALKPEVDEINKKYTSPDKAMEKQQATMALYKKVGVNPMGGCLPMLFQFPVLIAMFYFFPGSIELRQESFLWAKDLSTYDSILNLPFTVPFGYGDHVSLFTLLMTVTTILQTRLQGQTQDTSAMPGMKYMMYFMPVFFMFILNSYSSGLSYYYFLANVFTIGQTYLIRQTVNEDKVRAQLMANKKKAPKPKSGFQKRLEDLARQQEAARKTKK